MKDSPTLIDKTIRQMLKEKHSKAMLADLLKARKFVLSDQMSAHLADLCNAAFVAHPKKILEIADHARCFARIPHAVTWVEYNFKERRKRAAAEYPNLRMVSGDRWKDVALKEGVDFGNDEVVPRMGWLIKQHPVNPAAFIFRQFSDLDIEVAPNPYQEFWIADDSQSPWKRSELPFVQEVKILPSGDIITADQAALATGILRYRSQQVGIVLGDNLDAGRLSMIIRESMGEMRAVWALFATINELPILASEVRPSKGYVASGAYRRFSAHTVIDIKIPGHRSMRSIANRAIAAMRRRARQVRGHWRKDWRKPAVALCEHQWKSVDGDLVCDRCDGRKIWIDEHSRGDASLGYVLHDYTVSRATEEKTR